MVSKQEPVVVKQDNTMLWLVIAGLVAFIVWDQNQQQPNPSPPGPAPNPAVVVPQEEAVQLAATCRVLALAVEAGGCKTGSDVAMAWGYADEFAFAGAKLSDSAMSWSRQAGRRIQTAAGETGATPATLTQQTRSAVVQELRKLSVELAGR